MNSKTYHRSFIGLMEQCNDGEWCKRKEVNKEIEHFKGEAFFWQRQYDIYFLKYIKASKSRSRYGLISILCLFSLILSSIINILFISGVLK